MLHQTMFNADGRKRAAMFGYAAARNSSEIYTSEQEVVEFGQAPMMMNIRNGPKKMDLYNDNNPFLVPWGSPRGTDRASEFSPKKQHGQIKKAPPPNYGKSEQFHNKQDYNNYNDDNDNDDYGHDLTCDDGVCVRDDHKDKGKIYDAGKSKHKGNNSYNHDPPPYYNVPPNSYNNDRYKGNEYSSSPRSYPTGPFSNKPSIKKETHVDYNEKDKGRNSIPKTDVHYESSHNNPIGNSRETRPSYISKRMDFPNNNQRTKALNQMVAQQPKYSSSPQSNDSERQEVIDSNEARRRHARSSPHIRSKVEENYTGTTIDCQEAARRYNGVFVP